MGSNTRGRASGGRYPAPITLRELRIRCDLSLRTLADLAELTPAVVSQIENGRLQAKPAELENLERALGLPRGSLETRSLVVQAA